MWWRSLWRFRGRAAVCRGSSSVLAPVVLGRPVRVVAAIEPVVSIAALTNVVVLGPAAAAAVVVAAAAASRAAIAVVPVGSRSRAAIVRPIVRAGGVDVLVIRVRVPGALVRVLRSVVEPAPVLAVAFCVRGAVGVVVPIPPVIVAPRFGGATASGAATVPHRVDVAAAVVSGFLNVPTRLSFVPR